MKYIRCNLCDSNKYKTIHKIHVNNKKLRYYIFSQNIEDKTLLKTYTIVKCTNCGLIFTNPQLDEKELSTLYSSNNCIGGNWQTFKYLFNLNKSDNLQNLQKKDYVYNFNDTEWRDRILKTAKKYIKKESLTLLDIGCGDGKFVEYCNLKKIDAIGFDINPERVAIAHKHGNFNVFNKLPEKYKTTKFDVVTAWDVIEHTTNPKYFLEEIKNYLNDNGVIILLTLNIESIFYKILKQNWYYIDPMQHTFYFSKKTLTQLANKTGLEIISITKDYTQDRTTANLIKKGFKSLYFNTFNHLYFKLFTNKILYNLLGKHILKYHKIEHKRMKKRLENLYPYIFSENYNDNLVYIIRKKK